MNGRTDLTQIQTQTQTQTVNQTVNQTGMQEPSRVPSTTSALTAVAPAGHQVLTSMQGIDQPVVRRGRGRPRKHPKDPVADAVQVMITRARAEAHTIQQKLAQVVNPTSWALSPISHRRHPTEADIG